MAVKNVRLGCHKNLLALRPQQIKKKIIIIIINKTSRIFFITMYFGRLIKQREKVEILFILFLFNFKLILSKVGYRTDYIGYICTFEEYYITIK